MSPRARLGHRIRAGRRATKRKKCGAVLAGSAEYLCWVRGHAATDFFAAFDCGFDVDFGADFFAAFPFSLAMNSCLTVVEIPSTSTL